METVTLDEIHNNIRNYYLEYGEDYVMSDLNITVTDAILQEILIPIENLKFEKARKKFYDWLEKHGYDYSGIEYAFRFIVSSDKQKAQDESMRRMIKMRFTYLLRQVLYFDMNRIKVGNTYHIPRIEQPIIEEILLRSFSHNIFDNIIFEWLTNKIQDDDYNRIVELSDRLFWVIENVKDADENTKERWISALRIALRSDWAYTMCESEMLLRQIFSQAMSSSHLVTNPYSEKEHLTLTQEDLRQKVQTTLDGLAASVQHDLPVTLYEFVDSFDFDCLQSCETLASVEVMQMKNACELFCTYDLLKAGYPHQKKINMLIDYFESVDKDFQEKQEKRKRADHVRYEKNKRKKSKQD